VTICFGAGNVISNVGFGAAFMWFVLV